MVAGMQPNFSKATDEELDELLNVDVIKKRLKASVTINFNFDIPYLAGYSVDAKTIFFDRHLPSYIKVRTVDGLSKIIDPAKFIVWHEILEKALEDYFFMPYEEAHKFATKYEHRKVTEQGIDPVDYEKQLAPYIKKDEHEKLVRPPFFTGGKALDLTPYTGRLAELLRAAQTGV